MRPRFLLLARGLPFPLNRGGGAQRSELLRRSLAALGEVDMICLDVPERDMPLVTDPHVAEGLGLVAAFGESEPQQRIGRPWPWLPAPARRVQQRLVAQSQTYAVKPAPAAAVRTLVDSRRYAAVAARYLATAAWCDLGSLDGVRRIIDIDDVDWRFLGSMIASQPWPGWRGRIAARLSASNLERTCRRIAEAADHVWVASRHDQRVVEPIRSTVLPNIPFDQPSILMSASEPPASTETILFVGQLSYRPNAAGLGHFIERVWPRVRHARPHATLRVVGGGLSETLQSEWSKVDGIDLAGFVDDLSMEYSTATFAIVPVRYGGGTKIKVLEALSYSRTCVVTSHVAEGYSGCLSDGDQYLVASSDEAFVRCCLRLLEDAPMRSTLAASGRACVTRLFSPAAFHEGVVAGLSRGGV